MIQLSLKVKGVKMKNKRLLVRLCAEASLDAYFCTPTIECRETDTQVLIRKYNNFIIVAFRGTSSGTDVIQDLKRIQVDNGHGDVHKGFEQCVSSVFDDVVEELKWTGKDVIFTGHSLGGSEAQLAAVKYSYKCSCITFGSPRVGDKEFCNKLISETSGDLILFEHRLDRVTWVPFFGYTKPKSCIKKLWNWSLFAKSAHSMENYKELVTHYNE